MVQRWNLRGHPQNRLVLSWRGHQRNCLGLKNWVVSLKARRTNYSDFGVSAFAVAEMGLSAHSHPK
jgi:hypothetical protein